MTDDINTLSVEEQEQVMDVVLHTLRPTKATRPIFEGFVVDLLVTMPKLVQEDGSWCATMQANTFLGSVVHKLMEAAQSLNEELLTAETRPERKGMFELTRLEKLQAVQDLMNASKLSKDYGSSKYTDMVKSLARAVRDAEIYAFGDTRTAKTAAVAAYLEAISEGPQPTQS